MSNASFKRRNAELQAIRAAKVSSYEIETSAFVTRTGYATRKVKARKYATSVTTRTDRVVQSYRAVEPSTGIQERPNYVWQGPRLGRI